MILERATLNQKIKTETINSVMCELKKIFGNYCASYKLDSAHNILALLDNDKQMEIHYELYNDKGVVLCDLMVFETENATEEDLLKIVTKIVNSYYEIKN